MFPSSFLFALIVAALVLTAGSGIALLVLLVKDHRRRRLW